MEYKEYSPSKNFRDLVHSYWVFRVFKNETLTFPIKHETLPDSCLSIVAIDQPYFRGVRALGPHSKKFQIDLHPGSLYVGIRFHAWIEFETSLFVKPDTVNQTLEIPSALEAYFASLTEPEQQENISARLIEKKLSAFLRDIPIQENNLVKYICMHLDNDQPVGETIASIPSSVRVIQKKFKEVTGITMRQYAINSRLRRLWVDFIRYPDEKRELIYRYNYYDQSHFINDFKKKMKRPYTDFKDYMNSVEVSFSEN